MRSYLFVAASALLASPAFAANNIVNGGFEADSFTGWTRFGNTAFDGVVGDQFGVPPFDRNRQAFLGANGSPGGLSQSFASVIGQTYNFSFAVYADHGGQFFDAAIGGGSVLTLGGSGHGYLSFDFNHVATSTTTDVTFTYRHDAGFYLLDNVRATSAVPEPASWALLIAGFGLVGAGLRRRRMAAV